jgi:hypothetical protein
MPPVVMALIFAPLALLSGWSILRAVQTGQIRDEAWSVQGASPGGFALAIAGRALVCAFGVAEVLYAFGLMSDPIQMFRTALHAVL